MTNVVTCNSDIKKLTLTGVTRIDKFQGRLRNCSQSRKLYLTVEGHSQPVCPKGRSMVVCVSFELSFLQLKK